MMGRLLSGNKDAGIVVTYDHGYSITEDDFARMLAAANITSPQNLKLGLVGGFVLQANQTVSLHRSGHSGVGGSHRVWVDKRSYNIGPNNSYNVTDNIRLNAGLHVVQWELAGDDLGTAQLEIRAEPTTSGGSTALLPMSVDRTVEQAAHQLPSKATVHFGSR
jgi:long-subunit fatty acid transport protein